ncbi:hypothetical protein IEQ34_012222 [Dendrobium chrysotoxum]|uniref:WPP domain-interacting protein n=1 Tax=Dendrobium chrysotoxum TaxID=161865 RepID=A0AAV7GUU1_DENCH|nr:hypothetical protein IEQ34_012222 [Dendrobium chrysotoxum]
MDLEEERPTSKSVEGEKGSVTSNKMLPSDEIRADSHDEVAPEEPPKLVDTTENFFTDPAVAVFESLVEAVGSPPTVANPIRDETTKEISSNSNQSPASNTELVESTPVVTKGNGLRKWRRIKRDFKKDGCSSADSAQILKRRLQNTEPFKSEEDNKLKSKAEVDGEDSVASLESRNADINPLPVATGALNLELERLASGGFSIGMDSDNSEDHNSKSSTATSAPRLRHEALASGKDRGRLKFFCGKGTTRPGIQKVQQGRGGTVDASKKNKGDLARFEENSLSSVESDLRSSVAGVAQWGSVVDSNGKHNGRSSNFDEHSDEAHTGEEARSGYFKENGKAENLSSEDLDAELLKENNQKSGNFQSSSDIDPLIESMGSLQEAEEALEKEIQKIAEMGKQYDENDRQFEGIVPYNSQMLEAYLVDLRKKAENQESKLEEASTILEAKEQKLRELESLLSQAQLPNMEATCDHLLPIQAYEEELDSELEVLIKEKMEAEIEYLIITKTIQNWKILFEDHIALCKEQRYLAGDQEQIMLKLQDAEDKIIMLNVQKDKLEAYCKELVATENVLRLQNKVCRFSFCVIVQLMLLSISFVLFLMQLLSPVDDVVPT